VQSIEREGIMMLYWVAGLLTLALLVYLFVALLRPEVLE